MTVHGSLNLTGPYLHNNVVQSIAATGQPPVGVCTATIVRKVLAAPICRRVC